MDEKNISTKDRIVLKAVELFNSSGTQNITTNHIAKGAGISAGNLYYHFRNKEEIIRAVYEKITLEFDFLWERKDESEELYNIWEKISESLKLFYKYRFFMTEIVSLIKNDKLLKERYIVAKSKREKELKEIFLGYKRNGYIKEHITEDDIEAVVDILWFTGDFWIMRNEFKEQPDSIATKEEIEKYIKATYIICSGYFKDEALKKFYP